MNDSIKCLIESEYEAKERILEAEKAGERTYDQAKHDAETYLSKYQAKKNSELEEYIKFKENELDELKEKLSKILEEEIQIIKETKTDEIVEEILLLVTKGQVLKN